LLFLSGVGCRRGEAQKTQANVLKQLWRLGKLLPADSEWIGAIPSSLTPVQCCAGFSFPALGCMSAGVLSIRVPPVALPEGEG
jgi:hypothetical protein